MFCLFLFVRIEMFLDRENGHNRKLSFVLVITREDVGKEREQGRGCPLAICKLRPTPLFPPRSFSANKERGRRKEETRRIFFKQIRRCPKGRRPPLSETILTYQPNRLIHSSSITSPKLRIDFKQRQILWWMFLHVSLNSSKKNSFRFDYLLFVMRLSMIIYFSNTLMPLK